MGGRGGKGGAGAGLAGPEGPRDKMAAPRRPRGDVQEDEDEGRSPESKRLRGQRRLLVVLEGASLETVKVRAVGGRARSGRALDPLAPLSAVRALAVGGEDFRAAQLRQAQGAAATERPGPRGGAARHHPSGIRWVRRRLWRPGLFRVVRQGSGRSSLGFGGPLVPLEPGDEFGGV